MKISDQFERFKDERALFIVTSKHAATIYETKDGILEEKVSFSIQKPEYNGGLSDKAGHFESEADGIVTETGFTGGTSEDGSRITLLAKLLRSHLRNLSLGSVNEVFIFTPSTVKSTLIRHISPWIQSKMHIIDGNFYHIHPFKLLEKIELHSIPMNVVRTSEEAQKILNTYRF